jgi:hypothetical protein
LAWLAKLPNCTAHPRPATTGFAALVANVGGGAAVSSGSATATALAASPRGASDGWVLAAAASTTGAGALLVARSTVTLRTGSGVLTGSLRLAGAGAGPGGPDNNSGTINTMSTTKIDAPTRRSLTRRSIELVQP